MPSSPAVRSDEETWEEGDLAESGAEERVGVERRLCNFNESSRARRGMYRRKYPG